MHLHQAFAADTIYITGFANGLAHEDILHESARRILGHHHIFHEPVNRSCGKAAIRDFHIYGLDHIPVRLGNGFEIVPYGCIGSGFHHVAYGMGDIFQFPFHILFHSFFHIMPYGKGSYPHCSGKQQRIYSQKSDTDGKISETEK